ncbi:MAG: glycosyltransferase family 2 protein, partial [Proteocatella sp.]
MEYLVSTIIPTYKRADMLDRAILSVLNQTYKCVEVVVVDDNDPNSEWRIKTKNIMSKYQGDKRIKYICHEKNMNGSVARNTGIKNASGEIVCFLDDDDEFEKNKIQNQLNYLLENREFHAVYCGWDRDNKIVVPQKTGDLSYELLSGTNLIYTNAIMMYKQDAINCGGWDESFMRHQEAAFMLRYFRYGGKIGVVSENLVKFD